MTMTRPGQSHELGRPAGGRGAAASRVLIAGGGIAGLETLLALRKLVTDRVDITLLAPELEFVNRSTAVEQPFKPHRAGGPRLQDIAAGLGARWHRGALGRVEHDRQRVVTSAGEELAYDRLVLALGAHSAPARELEGVLAFPGGCDGSDYRLLLHHLRERQVKRLAFVRPAGASWPLPLYDLALMTAAECAAHERSDVQLTLVTPETAPLGIFGTPISDAIRRLLDEHMVTLYTSSYGAPGHPGWLAIAPGKRGLPVDRVVTLPRLLGPRPRGIPCGPDGFIQTDLHGRLAGLDGVFAAGDATAFPVKQGGLAAQQAEVVAQAIAASVGANIDPQPFRPILRGALLTGAATRHLRADISGGAGDDSMIAGEALRWPPDKLCGRHLGHYFSTRPERTSIHP